MNWKIFDSDTPVLIQGITGKEGQRMARWLIQSGVKVVAGVTPGKGGQEAEGCPVYNSVSEARKAFPDLLVSCIVVPPARVLSAVQEAVAAGIEFMDILTEQVPVHDVLAMRELAAKNQATILGPSSVGYLQFPAFRLGYLGGDNPFQYLNEGSAAIVSTSGGMTNELLMSLAHHGIGAKLAFAIGGDRVTGISIEEAITWSEDREEVKFLVIFIEPGRPLLRSLLAGMFRFRKPAVVFLAGESLDDLPRGLPYGHTGTVLGEDDQSVADIRKGLKEKGITCVGTMNELIEDCKKYV
jgi:succinyl-CoA synthetase alpha subunit